MTLKDSYTVEEWIARPRSITNRTRGKDGCETCNGRGWVQFSGGFTTNEIKTKDGKVLPAKQVRIEPTWIPCGRCKPSVTRTY